MNCVKKQPYSPLNFDKRFPGIVEVYQLPFVDIFPIQQAIFLTTVLISLFCTPRGLYKFLRIQKNKNKNEETN